MATDYDILDDVTARLVATGQFDAVYQAPPESLGGPAGDRFAAQVEPGSWEEVDEDDPEQPLHRARWLLTLFVRDEDALLRDRALDRLLNVAQNALDGQSLAGVTVPGWTRLRRGKFEVATPPQRKMTIHGEFAYWVEGFGGHDETE